MTYGESKILTGDCRELMAQLPCQHFQCCVTSPPYFGLRSYLPDAVAFRKDLSDEEKQKIKQRLAELNIHPIKESL